ncbi:MAG: hypothetical protein JWM36_4344 [Hyphomicrobiales bacterium]|nr:hypothetical protein [Hyphomicrobiales bacterium]
MLRLITPPAEEPISISEAKSHLRVEHDEDDDLIGSYVAAARHHLEMMTGRAFVTQTWEAVCNAFSCHGMELARVPVQSVVSIKFDDVTGTEQTLPSDRYVLDNLREPAWLIAGATNGWPSTADAVNAVRVQFVAGYGAAASVPVSIKQAMKLLVGHWYASREAVDASGRGSELPFGVIALISPYRLWF